MSNVKEFPPVKSERINELVKQARRQEMRAHIDDAIRRVEAAKARERQARLERVVVDDFVKRRQRQLPVSVSAGDQKPSVQVAKLAYKKQLVSDEIVKLARREFAAHLSRRLKKGQKVRVLKRPYHEGLSYVRAVLEVNGSRRRVYFNGSWKLARTSGYEAESTSGKGRSSTFVDSLRAAFGKPKEKGRVFLLEPGLRRGHKRGSGRISSDRTSCLKLASDDAVVIPIDGPMRR